MESPDGVLHRLQTRSGQTRGALSTGYTLTPRGGGGGWAAAAARGWVERKEEKGVCFSVSYPYTESTPQTSARGYRPVATRNGGRDDPFDRSAPRTPTTPITNSQGEPDGEFFVFDDRTTDGNSRSSSSPSCDTGGHKHERPGRTSATRLAATPSSRKGGRHTRLHFTGCREQCTTCRPSYPGRATGEPQVHNHSRTAIRASNSSRRQYAKLSVRSGPQTERTVSGSRVHVSTSDSLRMQCQWWITTETRNTTAPLHSLQPQLQNCTAILQPPPPPRAPHNPRSLFRRLDWPQSGQLMQAAFGCRATTARAKEAVECCTSWWCGLVHGPTGGGRRCGCLAGLVSCRYRISDGRDRPSDSFLQNPSGPAWGACSFVKARHSVRQVGCRLACRRCCCFLRKGVCIYLQEVCACEITDYRLHGAPSTKYVGMYVRTP